MKTTVFLMCAVLTAVVPSKAKADTITIDGITWTYSYSGTVGTGTSSGQAVPRTTVGAIAIPDKTGGNIVRSIANWAFHQCSKLTFVEIPDSVTNIGDRAFYDCSSLTEATIPNSVTRIGDLAYCNCRALTSLTIGNSVFSIGDNAFLSCTNLTSLVIPDSVTSIGRSAFYNCHGLTSVTIGNSVTSIGDSAFYGCTNLTSVTIGNSVTSIGNNAFYGCTNLTSVTIPDSVTSIGTNAFAGCSNLTSVTIPDSVQWIPVTAFEGTALWAKWYRTLSRLSESDGESGDFRYALTSACTDRAIATVMVDGDSAIDDFVLTDGKVFDTVLRIINVSDTPSTLSLPSGYTYERLRGTSPLTIPASSTNLLTITRTADRVFFVAREELEPAQ